MSTSTPPTGPAGDPGTGPSGARRDPAGDSSAAGVDPEAQHEDDGPADEGGHAEGRRGHRGSRGGGWMEYLVTMVGALIIAVLVKTFLIQPFYIPSESMNPTLQVDDKIIVSKLTPGVFDLERGDVIVFEDPANWLEGDATENPTVRTRIMMVLSVVGLAPDPSQDHLVKRLIGLPGDHVVCSASGAAVQVNGVEVDEPYINPDGGACQRPFDVTVPSGSVWVMGDNRHASADSAWHFTHGEEAFVPVEDVTGKAVSVFWPVRNWAGLGDGSDAFAEVPAAP
ncbi:signal peptidase I [Brachybacterium phenoliresistens]|uniref:Signal peptidase I n=1 Tax=Brachybacterium phenoliresistens TaxID=396014 RepID=Z9JTQ5_9MICO|nr:signal peptidase I [Brachybacterium phenoliresistens]EWS81181.1 hypothetical protein BF93_18615 [Brachybacterium phenoliresistens]